MKLACLLLLLPAAAAAEVPPVSVTAGGGLVQFTDPGMRSFATEGAGWEARLAYYARPFLSIEAVYSGSLHSIDATGMPGATYLLGTGVDIDVRVGVLYESGVEPYFLAGLGWGQYRLTRTSGNTSPVHDIDNIGQVPLALGVSFHRGRTLVDLRAAHRVTSWVDTFANTIDNGFDSWSFSLSVGLTTGPTPRSAARSSGTGRK